jgi:ligand-binding sensor domain-containing protein
MKKLFLLFFLFVFSQSGKAQLTWTVYDTSNSGIPSNLIRGIAEDASGNIWVSTNRGIGKFDGTNWTVYDASNSQLPSNDCNGIADEGDTIWICTTGGFAKFDGTNWTIYNSIFVTCLTIDGNGNKWVGSYFNGVGKFDGTSWTVYDTGNSGLPQNLIRGIAVEPSGIAWFATGNYGGLAKLDGTIWTVYDTSNSGIPDNRTNGISIDNYGNKWVSTQNGLGKFNDTTWTVYDTSNSGLTSNFVLGVRFDLSNNKWIAGGGLGLSILINDSDWIIYDSSNSPIIGSVASIFISNSTRWIGSGYFGLYKLEGDVRVNELEKTKVLIEVYPNPFSVSATLKITTSLKNGILFLYDVLGNEQRSTHIFNSEAKIEKGNLHNGIYFYKIISDGILAGTGKIIVQ